MSGFGRINPFFCRRIVALGVLFATGIGGASLHAQTQLLDPKDAPRIFASTCSACHKSPAGLAKSGQVAGFLRQHYTTGPEMSAAMAAYLVSAGSAPAGRKGQAEAKAKDQAKEQPGEIPAGKGKQRRQEASIQPGERSAEGKSAKELGKDAKDAKDSAKERRLLRKQLQAKAQEDRAAHPSPASAAEGASRPPAAANAALAETPTASAPAAVVAAAPATAAVPAAAPLMTLDIPLPEMPTAAPADLTQSVFSSSPVP